ncbi:hypothetical protein [Flavobacterium nackdongense]|uniref:Lipoprotein n=1 Tax=Flavobacterium nackdongense TaxID=2547394 RepID=A0A4P6Y9T6_9FLAO|nr:hypothetical protein [Flavobacterium nackdongense]QBN18828.1 hypothetical protein E1750_08430 [Flavobacterium nackdongense]
MKKAKESINILKRKNIINLYFLIFFQFLILVSCKRDETKHFLYSNNGKSNFYEIIYLKDKIILINNSSVNNIINKDTSIFTKKKGQYFSSHKGTKNDKESLIMSISKDTVYEYQNIGKFFLYKIGKNGNETFKAVSINVDSLKFKLKTSIYYDTKYNIFMIEEFINGKTTQWKSY